MYSMNEIRNDLKKHPQIHQAILKNTTALYSGIISTHHCLLKTCTHTYLCFGVLLHWNYEDSLSFVYCQPQAHGVNDMQQAAVCHHDDSLGSGHWADLSTAWSATRNR